MNADEAKRLRDEAKRRLHRKEAWAHQAFHEAIAPDTAYHNPKEDA